MSVKGVGTNYIYIKDINDKKYQNFIGFNENKKGEIKYYIKDEQKAYQYVNENEYETIGYKQEPFFKSLVEKGFVYVISNNLKKSLKNLRSCSYGEKEKYKEINVIQSHCMIKKISLAELKNLD